MGMGSTGLGLGMAWLLRSWSGLFMGWVVHGLLWLCIVRDVHGLCMSGHDLFSAWAGLRICFAGRSMGCSSHGLGWAWIVVGMSWTVHVLGSAWAGH
jgi:hypothetical protein